jgi:hypothetical protein
LSAAGDGAGARARDGGGTLRHTGRAKAASISDASGKDSMEIPTLYV